MIQSVSRAMDILTTVSDMRGKPISLSAIAQRTNMNVSTCAHLVQTLCEKGFLSQVSRSSGYILGAYAYYLTRYKTFQKELVTICNPALRWIQRKTGHTALLAVLVEGEKFVISYAEDRKEILRERGELYRGTLYNSATGRAMLCSMRRTELLHLVEKIGLPTREDWPEVRTFEDMERALRLLQADRIVCIEIPDEGAYQAGFGICIHVPRFPICALGLKVQQEAIPTEEEISQIREALIIGAKEIQRRLRFEQDLM